MSTKEEHLADLVSANIEKSGAVARTTFGWLQQLAEARAERDAAEEDSRLTLEEHLRVVRQRDDAHDELEQARNRIEFLENGAAPVPSPAPILHGLNITGQVTIAYSRRGLVTDCTNDSREPGPIRLQRGDDWVELRPRMTDAEAAAVHAAMEEKADAT
jgi:trehalose-6-phosphatase